MFILLSGKYHMGSLVAIFFALGIGILIGGSLGQQWMFQTEQHTLSILMDKYESQIEENQKLQKENNSLQIMHRTVVPMLEHKRILWIRPHTLQNDMLSEMIISTGADWIETEADTWLSGLSAQSTETKQTDMIIISDPQQIDLITRLQAKLQEGDLDESTEQATSTPQGIDHRTSME